MISVPNSDIVSTSSRNNSMPHMGILLLSLQTPYDSCVVSFIAAIRTGHATKQQILKLRISYMSQLTNPKFFIVRYNLVTTYGTQRRRDKDHIHTK
jgi:hypothetical protein